MQSQAVRGTCGDRGAQGGPAASVCRALSAAAHAHRHTHASGMRRPSTRVPAPSGTASLEGGHIPVSGVLSVFLRSSAWQSSDPAVLGHFGDLTPDLDLITAMALRAWSQSVQRPLLSASPV